MKMSLKRKANDQSIVIDSSDGDCDFQCSIDKKAGAKSPSVLSTRKRRHLSVSHKTAKIDSSSDEEGHSVVRVEADVHRNKQGARQSNAQVECEIIKVVPSNNQLTAQQSIIVPDVITEVEVKQEDQSGDVANNGNVVIISSDDDADDDDDKTASEGLDESFSQNQEGSRRVQDLIFQQEMGT